MKYQATFERYELKYLLTRAQKEFVLRVLEPYMELDHYGRTSIRNLYYDTDTFRLVRRSLERPAYKEKLRVRSYRAAGPEDSVFVELKKKYRSVVYKRRLAVPQQQALRCLREGTPFSNETQVAREIEYFRDYYRTLRPVVFLSYEREAFREKNGGDFRVTFDENILFRETNLTLQADAYGTPLLAPDTALMEVKTSGGIPLWLVHAMTAARIFKTSFSKYGAAYQEMQRSEEKGERIYA